MTKKAAAPKTPAAKSAKLNKGRKQDPDKLTVKEQRFVEEYLVDANMNATTAAVRAGYSERSAHSAGHRLLNKPRVALAIAQAMKERSERVQVNADYVLKRLIAIDQMDIKDILNEDQSIKNVSDWPPVWRQYVTGIDLAEMFEGQGSERELVGILKKMKWPDKVRNLELLGKHIKVMAFAEKTVHGFDESAADILSKARQRAGKK